jgi:RNA polymerase sigma-70 factor (ECF subfamily)
MSIRNEPADSVAATGRSDASELETLYVGLVRDHHRRIYNYVFRLVGDSRTAEDVTQEAFLRAYRGLPKLPAGAHYRAWLYRIATNAARDELRRRRRRPQAPLESAGALVAPTTPEDRRLDRICLDEALMAIDPNHRTILMLFEFSEMTAPEVGEVLGISPEAARKRRQRAREALARVLDAREERT